jgi:FkbM family methyltransferase
MLRNLKRRVRNAWAAFHPGETGYRLALGSHGEFNVAYREGTADEKVIAHSFANDIFFSGVPEYQPRADDVIVDIGAHIGTFSLLAASKAPRGRVHAVEASQETFNYLRINAALNPTLNLIPHRLALTDQDGVVTLHHDSGNWGHSIMKRLHSAGESVQAMSLGSFLQANGIDEVAFIKFNCEGAEFPILMTASREVLRRVRMMLILYHLDLAEHYTREALLARLSEADYQIDLRNLTRRRGWIIATRRS